MITQCAPLVSLVYVSSAVELFSQAELLALLKISRRNNAPAGITGLLLYKEGNFMQVIEGEQTAIDRLQAKIARDPRHKGLLTLTQRPITQRQFSEWSMGFKNLSDPGLRTLPGYNEFLNTPLIGAEFADQPSRAERLLQAFKQKM